MVSVWYLCISYFFTSYESFLSCWSLLKISHFLFDRPLSILIMFADVPEGCVIIKEHIPISNLFTCLWFNEVDRFTPRDQISFAIVRDKIMSKTNWTVNMFLDCERRNFVIQVIFISFTIWTFSSKIKQRTAFMHLITWRFAQKVHFMLMLAPDMIQVEEHAIRNCYHRST